MTRAMPMMWALSGAALLLFTSNLSAATIITQTYSGTFPATITGTLPNQGTALEEVFTLPSATTLTVTTTSYATGGFESNLLLFNSAGTFVTAGTPFGSPDPSTGIVGDMRMTVPNLPAGMYTLALTDFQLNQSLTATNLSAGFSVNYGSGSTFTDANGNVRTGNYAFTISTASAVPEPATFWLVVPIVTGLFGCCRGFEKCAKACGLKDGSSIRSSSNVE
jgi:hypothetical protein